MKFYKFGDPKYLIAEVFYHHFNTCSAVNRLEYKSDKFSPFPFLWEFHHCKYCMPKQSISLFLLLSYTFQRNKIYLWYIQYFADSRGSPLLVCMSRCEQIWMNTLVLQFLWRFVHFTCCYMYEALHILWFTYLSEYKYHKKDGWVWQTKCPFNTEYQLQVKSLKSALTFWHFLYLR